MGSTCSLNLPLTDEHCEHVTSGRRRISANLISHGIQIAASPQLNASGPQVISSPADDEQLWQILSTGTTDIYGPLQCRLLRIYSRPPQLNVLALYFGINNGEHCGEGQ